MALNTNYHTLLLKSQSTATLKSSNLISLFLTQATPSSFVKGIPTCKVPPAVQLHSVELHWQTSHLIENCVQPLVDRGTAPCEVVPIPYVLWTGQAPVHCVG